MTTTKLIHCTRDAEQLIAYMGRVSNVEGQENPEYAKLFSYLIRNKHWSPFEMASACIEINTTRDISHQITRHRSFHFQEFSQRYADVSDLGEMVERECRMQDTKNRQSSMECTDDWIKEGWSAAQHKVWGVAVKGYKDALERGIAKEQARALLPEGLTPTRVYMHGTLRDWIHYIEVRADPSTQKEHRLVAEGAYDLLHKECPAVFAAVAV